MIRPFSQLPALPTRIRQGQMTSDLKQDRSLESVPIEQQMYRHPRRLTFKPGK